MKNNIGVLNWIIFTALALTWGSSFILMKRGLEVYTPSQVASIRMTVAFIFLLPLGIYNIKKADFKTNWKYFLVVGLTGNLIPAFLFATAQTGISSSMAGMLNALTPLFTLLLAIVVFKNRFSTLQLTGLFMGLAGAVILMYWRGSGAESKDATMGWLLVLATFLYGVSVNTIRNYLTDINSVAITAFAFCGAGPIAVIYLFSTDFTSVLTTNPMALKGLGYLTLLGVFGTALAVIFYNMLIKQSSILFASSVTYLIPVVALLWGYADGESISEKYYACIAIILGGVYLVTKK